MVQKDLGHLKERHTTNYESKKNKILYSVENLKRRILFWLIKIPAYQ